MKFKHEEEYMRLNRVHTGEIFRFENLYYLKIDPDNYEKFNAVSLDGFPEQIDEELWVTKVNPELKLK